MSGPLATDAIAGSRAHPVCRLAPSPTGAQHLGNARTFLLAYWSARSQNARLILRIEDIDSPRVKPWAADQAIQDLLWLGIEWDGPPIIQTERVDRYDQVLRALVEKDLVYPCVCTRRDIEAAASAPHEQTPGENQPNPTHPPGAFAAEGPLYPGTCATWHRGDPLPDPAKTCWRFRVHGGEMAFDDLIAGRPTCDVAEVLGDFPVTRKGGLAAYQLAVVVDDLHAGVTEVVRGDDLIFSTFRQLQLIDALAGTPPRYAHVPLVVGDDGRRLAKRHGDTRLSHYRERGIDAAAIVHWAARTAGLLPKPAHAASRTCSLEPLESLHRRVIDAFAWQRVSNQRIVAGQTWSPESGNA